MAISQVPGVALSPFGKETKMRFHSTSPPSLGAIVIDGSVDPAGRSQLPEKEGHECKSDW